MNRGPVWVVEGHDGARFPACSHSHAWAAAVNLGGEMRVAPTAPPSGASWCLHCAHCGRLVNAPDKGDGCMLHGTSCPETEPLSTLLAADVRGLFGRPLDAEAERVLSLLLGVLDGPNSGADAGVLADALEHALGPAE